MTKSILVFDDDTDLQALLTLYFEPRGYRILTTSDGTGAIELAKTHKPDVIVMDTLMPGKGGLEACRDLRRAGIATPIVMLTSKDLEEDKRRALEAGANAFQSKPFNPKELEVVIRSLLAA